MTGEFTYVSRPRSPRRAQRKDKFKTQESSVEWIDERFRDTQTRFQQSALCRRYIGTERRHSPESRVINRDAQIEEFEEVVIKAGLGVPERFVCLGLGGFVERPPFRRRVSEVQLSLFLELNTLCKASMVVCDPSFDELDKEFLLTKGVQVEKLEAKDYEANSARTFFFLPHCEDWLNEAVLSGLIATSSLQNAVLIMNDIRKYPLTKQKVHQATVKVLNENLLEFKELDPDKKEIIDFRDAFVNLSLMWTSVASTALAD